MQNDSQILIKLRPYLRACPHILIYQLATKAFIGVWVFLLGRLFQVLLKSSGRVALTSGDFKFLFGTWQGILILLLGLVSLFIYVAVDLNAKVALSRNLLTGQKASFTDCLRDGFRSVRKLLNLRGTLVVIYIALIAPILRVGLSY